MSDCPLATLLHTIRSHTGDVTGCSFTGKTLATCSGDKTVRLWNIDDDYNFSELQYSPLYGHTYSVHYCCFSPFGTMLATCSTDGKVILWNVKNGERICTFEHPSMNAIRVCRFSSNSSLLITGSDDDTIVIWDVTSKKRIRTLEGHEATVMACAFSPDCSFIASGSTKGDLRLWDARYGHGKCLALVIEGHDLGVTGCDFSPTFGMSDGSNYNHFLLATCGNDNAVKLWDVIVDTQCGIVLRQILEGHGANVMCCTFSHNGRLLASGSGDKTVLLWNPLSGELLHRIQKHNRYVTCCAFSSDDSLLATGSNDKTVFVWKIVAEQDLKNDVTETDLQAAEGNIQVTNTLAEWTIDDVCQWLTEIGLSQYVEAFRDNAIDGQELTTLTHENLITALGVVALGHRNKILRGITRLREHPSAHFPVELDNVENGVPDEYLCPITREIMRNPVMAADGYTYEHAAILAWLNSGKITSPMTNAALSHTDLTPNRMLKMIIQRHLQQQ